MTRIELEAGAATVDAAVIGEAFGIPPSQVPAAIRTGTITSRFERGEGADAGRCRLTFFHGSRRLRLVVDPAGQIIQRSLVDFGDRPLPPAMHRRSG
jgi:hypothetical protein